MLIKNQVQTQILQEVRRNYTIAIFDNREQENTGKLRVRHARIVTTSNYKRYREFVNLATKGRFNFVVYENIIVNGKNVKTKVTAYDPKRDEEFETTVKAKIAS